jgi:hypothetical protein
MPRKDVNFKTGEARYKNISVDADVIALLNSKADELEGRFGFRPTLSQTVRYLVRKENN